MGASITHNMYSDSKNEITGVKESESKMTTLVLYGDCVMSETATLTGNIEYSKLGTSDQHNGGTVIGLIAGARFAF